MSPIRLVRSVDESAPGFSRRPGRSAAACSCLILLLALMGAGGSRAPEVSPRPANLDPVAASIRDLAGARTRVVWVQDVGDGADYLARGTDLRLMGLDTDDPSGERQILPPPRNIAKPLFTTDGNHVVFSDRIRGTMHRVGWEGGGVEDLGEGFAASVWRDPKTGIEWLYFLGDFVHDGSLLPTHGSLRRKPLKPLPRTRAAHVVSWRRRVREETLLANVRISEDSVQLTGDGRLASAAFPWPEVGYLDMHTRAWTRLARGCWVAMAPDAPYLFCVFDGPHRNVTMFQIEPRARWTVNISQLPGETGFEIYHPRWSNHPHVFAVTGPYKVGEGSYRLPGGGADVEVYLGRFREDRRDVERWARVTFNAYANFYPDVWVQPVPGTKGAAPVPEMTAAHDWTWPSDDRDLVYIWQTLDGRHEVPAPPGRPAVLCRPEPFGHARYGRHFEMLIEDGGFRDQEAGRRAVAALAGKTSFTFEFTAHQDGALADDEEATLLAVTGDGAPLASVGRMGDRMVFQAQERRILTDPIGWPAAAHLAAVVENDTVVLYLEGEPILEAAIAPMSWAPGAGELRFGDPRWRGRLEGVAVYGRALPAREIRMNRRLHRQTMSGRTPSTVREVQGRILATSGIPTPEEIAPYRRALVASEVEIIRNVGEGPVPQRILVAHWAILDARVLGSAEREEGKVYAMHLEPFHDRPELEGERLAVDIENLLLDIYFDHRF